ncbi:hypothetical protein GQ457_03G026910 [Hibiscus cannabinus]
MGKNVVSGSRFATLVDISDSKVHGEGFDPTSYDRRMASMSFAAEENLVGFSHSPSSRNRDQLAANKKNNNEKSMVSLGTSVRVASQGRVVAAKSSLNADKHVAVQVLDSTLNPGPRVGKGRILPSSLRGGISKPVIKKPVGLSNLMEDLTNAENLERSKVEVSSFDAVGDGDSVSWIQNSTFVQGPASAMQGALDPGFNRSFKLLVRKRKPEIVIVMEPRNSGNAADIFIRRTGFDRSYSVEAHGFAGDAVKRRGLRSHLEALRLANEAAWVRGLRGNEELCLNVYHLVKLGSDHRPILLDTCPRVVVTGNRPFRYIAAWNEHPDFASFLKSVWSDSASIDQNVSLFQQRSRMWNSDVFGHIGRRKKQLLARIKGVELALEILGNSYLLMLEDDLKRELDSVLSQEESLWYQKART